MLLLFLKQIIGIFWNWNKVYYNKVYSICTVDYAYLIQTFRKQIWLSHLIVSASTLHYFYCFIWHRAKISEVYNGESEVKIVLSVWTKKTSQLPLNFLVTVLEYLCIDCFWIFLVHTKYLPKVHFKCIFTRYNHWNISANLEMARNIKFKSNHQNFSLLFQWTW